MDGPNQFTCDCRPGYAGQYCERGNCLYHNPIILRGGGGEGKREGKGEEEGYIAMLLVGLVRMDHSNSNVIVSLAMQGNTVKEVIVPCISYHIAGEGKRDILPYGL